MKNLAVLLRQENKQSTKLYNDVMQLTDKQRNQLKSMKFSDDVKVAVDAALSGKATSERTESPGKPRERRSY